MTAACYLFVGRGRGGRGVEGREERIMSKSKIMLKEGEVGAGGRYGSLLVML